MHKLIIIGLLIFVTGCTKKTVTFENDIELKSYSFKFVDKHKTDEPSYLTEHGNIWSCMYGVNPIPEKDIRPSKSLVIKNYLENNLQTELQNKAVELDRFDIYWNLQKPLRATSVPIVLPGVAIPILIDQPSSEPIYGCKGEMRGEYSMDEIPEVIRNIGVTPFIVHIQVTIDQVQFNVRITSLNSLVTSTVKETDQYAEILKATINEAFRDLHSKITGHLAINKLHSSIR